MKTITVNTSKGKYKVSICQSLIHIVKTVKPHLKTKSRNFLLVNKKVENLYKDTIQTVKDALNLRKIAIRGGEQSKSFSTVRRVVDFLISNGCDRSSTLVIIGGGTVGDLGGFCAGITLRGIPYIQVPTTLLAQVDSSIGGKTAINHPEGKNLVGLFYQPVSVCICIDFLETLSGREFTSGMGEVIKSAIIGDRTLFELLLRNHRSINRKSTDILQEMIFRSLEVKRNIVETDTMEKDRRMILNFGHTVGHAIEKLSNYRLSHGEAVIIGMMAAVILSKELTGLNESISGNLLRLLNYYSASFSPADFTVRDIMRIIENDKKWFGGSRRFILIRDVAKPEIVQNIPLNALENSIKQIIRMQSK